MTPEQLFNAYLSPNECGPALIYQAINGWLDREAWTTCGLMLFTFRACGLDGDHGASFWLCVARALHPARRHLDGYGRFLSALRHAIAMDDEEADVAAMFKGLSA